MRALSQSTRVKCCTSGSKSADMQESGEIVDTGAMLKEMALDCSASINNLGASHFPPPTFTALGFIKDLGVQVRGRGGLGGKGVGIGGGWCREREPELSLNTAQLLLCYW